MFCRPSEVTWPTLASGFGNRGQSGLLELCRAFDGSHEIRDEVEAALIGGLHLGPFRLCFLIELHKTVVGSRHCEAANNHDETATIPTMIRQNL